MEQKPQMDAKIAEWQTLARKAVKGRGTQEAGLNILNRYTEDKIEQKALFTETDQGNSLHDSWSATGAQVWSMAQNIEPYNDIKGLNQAILDEVEGGTKRIILAPEQDLTLLPQALNGVIIDAIEIAIDGAENPVQAAESMIAIWSSANINPEAAYGFIGVDILRNHGESQVMSATAIRDLLAKTLPIIENCPQLRLFDVNGSEIHRQGHSPAAELALCLAQTAALLRLMEEAGISPREGLSRLEITIAMDADLYGSIVKGRALRLLMSLMRKAMGIDGNADYHQQLRGITSDRMLSRLDQDTNIQRCGTAMLAMALSGLGTITNLPHDWLVGSSLEGRRLARNAHHILADEALLGHVIDPAQGSYFIDNATTALAEKAWKYFQEIENAGGFFKTVGKGVVQTWAKKAIDARQEYIDKGEDKLLGVTIHPVQTGKLSPCYEGRYGVRGGEFRPAKPWENIYEAMSQLAPRCLLLDIGVSVDPGKSAQIADKWFIASGIQASYITVENMTAAKKLIEQAKPDILVLGADNDQNLAMEIPVQLDSDAFTGNIRLLMEHIIETLTKGGNG